MDSEQTDHLLFNKQRVVYLFDMNYLVVVGLK